jgi:hypothetical protein|tara:strand:- start:2783 stop:3550 length:768 start_codon:yes stop_codon:yes gene_type:complete
MNQQEVMKKQPAGALSTDMFEADKHQDTGAMTQEDQALPFLKILSQLSPECNKRDAKYVKGAEPGMIINTVTNELFDGEKGIDVLPVYYKRQYIEWKDRGESGGAPVKIYEAGDDLPKTTRDKGNKDRLANGNYLETTASHYVIKLNGVPQRALLSMKATQLKTSRKWNSMMNNVILRGKNGLYQPPSFSHVYKLRSVQQSNDKGTWFGWDVSKVEPVKDRGSYEMAKAFSKQVSKGEVEAKHSSDSNTATKSHF